MRELSSQRAVPLLRFALGGTAWLAVGLAGLLLVAVYAQYEHTQGRLAARAGLLLALAAPALLGLGAACRRFVYRMRNDSATTEGEATGGRNAGVALLGCLLALLVALVVVQLALPLLDGLLDTTLTRIYLRSGVLLLPAGIALATGLLAGAPPAVPRPPRTVRAGPGGCASPCPFSLPRGFLIFPFAVSLFLIVTLLFAARQMGTAAQDPCASKPRVMPSSLLEAGPPRDFETYWHGLERRQARLRGLAASVASPQPAWAAAPMPQVACPRPCPGCPQPPECRG